MYNKQNGLERARCQLQNLCLLSFIYNLGDVIRKSRSMLEISKKRLKLHEY